MWAAGRRTPDAVVPLNQVYQEKIGVYKYVFVSRVKNRFRVGSISSHLQRCWEVPAYHSQSFTVLLWDMKDQLSLYLCRWFHPKNPSWELLAFWLVLPPSPLGFRVPVGRASRSPHVGCLPSSFFVPILCLSARICKIRKEMLEIETCGQPRFHLGRGGNAPPFLSLLEGTDLSASVIFLFSFFLPCFDNQTLS